jgi:hypothetical protein
MGQMRNADRILDGRPEYFEYLDVDGKITFK